jgi:hypothetical protein
MSLAREHDHRVLLAFLATHTLHRHKRMKPTAFGCLELPRQLSELTHWIEIGDIQLFQVSQGRERLERFIVGFDIGQVQGLSNHVERPWGFDSNFRPKSTRIRKLLASEVQRQ